MEDTGEKLSLHDLQNVRNTKAPGYEITRKEPPSTAKRYRVTQQCYIHGRLWEPGEIVSIEGEPASYMEAVDTDTPAPAKAAGRPKPSRDVI